jgi:hypothetical protein
MTGKNLKRRNNMARWRYDLTGAEPIVRDVPIYAASKIANGELLMEAATGGTAQAGFITCNALTTTAGVDALGVCLEDITTTSEADFGDIISTAATTATPAISRSPTVATNRARQGDHQGLRCILIR